MRVSVKAADRMPNPGGLTRRMKPVADLNSLLRRFDRIRVWTNNGKRARFKPLVVLLALGKLSQGQEELSFLEVDERLPKLVERFISGNLRPRPEQPFWRLRNDGVWKVDLEDRIRMTDSNDAFRQDLKGNDAPGRFTEDVMEVLTSDPQNIEILATQLLDANFPPYRHQVILEAVGLAPTRIMTARMRLKRAAGFRRAVLTAYEHRCCVCGYDLHVGGELTGLEAAHIQALYANGPDVVPNGLSLCVIHHNAFDRGALTIQDDRRTINCSQQLSGTSRMEWLTDFHGQKITDPRSSEDRPGKDHLAWHRRYTFLAPARNSP